MLFCLPFAALPYILALPIFLRTGYVALAVGLRALLTVVALPASLLNTAIGQNGFVTASCFAGAMLSLDRRDLPRTAGVQAAACRGVSLPLLLAWRLRALFASTAGAILLLATYWLVLGTCAWRAFFTATPFIVRSCTIRKSGRN